MRVGVAVLAGVIGLGGVLRVPPFVARIVDPIELRILDWHAQLRGTMPPPPGITLVAIDEGSLERIGHWPWPRTRTAELVRRLHAGGARVVGLDLLLTEPDQNTSLTLAQALAEQYRAFGLDRGGGSSARFARILDEALTAADPDRALTEALAATRRVVVPYVFVFAPNETSPIDDDARRRLNRSAIIALAEPEAREAIEPLVATGVILPLERFHEAAAGAGHVNVVPDLDGALRRTALVVRFGEADFPSLALETARIGLGLRRTDVRLTADQHVQLGRRRAPTDERGFMHLTYYGPRGTFPHLSAADVLTSSSPPPVQGHMVLVGFTALGLMDVRATPFDTQMPGVETHATALANLLEGRSLWRHVALRVPEAVAVLLLAAGSPLLLPRLGALWGTAAALGLAGAVAGIAHLAFRLGIWVELLPALAALAVSHVGSVTYQVLVEEAEGRWIKRAFRQYVPPEVVETVARDPAALAFGGDRRVMTVLFSDIRGYTTFAERHPPEEVVAVLHEYLTAMVAVVFRHKGTLDKFIGDAIMALFGAPLPDSEHALHACSAAIEMAETLERLNAQWRATGRETLSAGIGISSGEMVVGNLGSSQRFAYTVTGDQVNLAARLEGLTKDYQTRRKIIISEGTYAYVRERVTTRPLGSVTVKGKLQPVEIYEVIDVTPPEREARS
ncbi:MAG: adenylate/guanylate cyclase domain-containing protein [Candidatus Rokubacteria bacterium]|nr:adenylate/guanylate cyclase domain-containing protein [Candidatus Rokubacteria bacterium]